MKIQKIFDGIGATANNDYAFGDVSPFLRGRDAVLMVVGTTNADFTVQFLDDNAVADTFAELIAATDLTGDPVQFFPIKVPHNLRATIASRIAGTCDVYLLCD